MNIEEWRSINGYPGYEVSNLGRIRSFRVANRWHVGMIGNSAKILAIHEDKNWGYWHLGLRKSDGTRVNLLVHKIVAEAFLGPSDGLEVNHKNAIKSDNRAENLEYVTALQNSKHARSLGLVRWIRGTQCPGCKLSEKDVINIREARKMGVKLSDLSSMYGVHFQTISAISRRKTWAWL